MFFLLDPHLEPWPGEGCDRRVWRRWKSGAAARVATPGRGAANPTDGGGAYLDNLDNCVCMCVCVYV